MKDLESILREHFHCNKPFLKTPRKTGTNFDGNPVYDCLTSAGAKAYDHLVALLYDLSNLGVFSSDSISHAIDNLDKIVDE